MINLCFRFAFFIGVFSMRFSSMLVLALMLSGDAHAEELVGEVGEDGQEAHPIEQWAVRLVGLREHPSLVGELRRLPVEEVLVVLRRRLRLAHRRLHAVARRLAHGWLLPGSRAHGRCRVCDLSRARQVEPGADEAIANGRT